jgi:predicted GNAT family N-acyltransferase
MTDSQCIKLAELSVVSVDADQTLPIRHKVLWPDQALDFSKVDGDEEARHFGVALNDELISVASIFFETDDTARLRKFATLPEFQGQGVGSHLLKHILEDLRSSGCSMLWCDGREAAKAFYQRLGFEASGERFFKKDVAYFKMTKRL